MCRNYGWEKEKDKYVCGADEIRLNSIFLRFAAAVVACPVWFILSFNSDSFPRF